MGLLCSFLLASTLLLANQKESADLLLEKAQRLELVSGRMEEAIELYRKAVAAPGANRGTIARALAEMGRLQEKLGNPQARQAYERLTREFADQTEPVAFARARLAELSTPAHPSQSVTRRLWSNPAVGQSAVSPNGLLLSFSDEDNGDLAVRDLVTGQIRRLTNKGSWLDSGDLAGTSAFSPDGSQIVFSWFIHKQDRYDLRIVNVRGDAAPRVVLDNREVRYIEPVAWSGDGNEILAAVQRADSTNQIAWVNLADGSIRTLKSLPGWRYPDKVSLSPDRRFIAYAMRQTDNGAENDIFLLSADGSREIPLVEHPADDRSPLWSPNGKRILFVSNRTGSRSLWSLSVTNGTPADLPELVRTDATNAKFLAFTREGSLFYAVNKNMSHVFVADLDPDTGKLLAPPQSVAKHFVGTNFLPAWSPDGEYLAYLSRRNGSRYGPGSTTIVIRSTKTGEERDLSSRLDHRQLSWFPDNRSLLVVVAGQARAGLYRVDIHTGETTFLLTESAYIPDPVFAVDGKTLYYLHGTKDGVRSQVSIRVRDLESQHERTLLTVDWNKFTLRNLVVSPDGSQLAYRLSDWKALTAEIRTMSSGGGDSRVLVSGHAEELSSYTPPGWSRDGRHLLFFRGDPKSGDRRLWRVPLAGGEPERLDLTGKGLSFSQFHPAGSRVAFSQGDWGDVELWVMQNLFSELRGAR